MAHVPGFDYDIFISYSWNDNRALGETPGWVDQFHERLESWLKHRRGLAELAIWRDRKEHGNTAFDLAIENKIKSSTLFFALHSRNFLKSEYCAKELALFHQFRGDRAGGLLVGEQSCIFNILLNNVPHGQWPQGLGRTSGFPMHDARADELGDFTSPNDSRFEKQLRAIVDAVEVTLAVFPQSREPAPPPEPQAVCVFVAYVADTLQLRRDRLLEELKQAGVEIVTGVPPPLMPISEIIVCCSPKRPLPGSPSANIANPSKP